MPFLNKAQNYCFLSITKLTKKMRGTKTFSSYFNFFLFLLHFGSKAFPQPWVPEFFGKILNKRSKVIFQKQVSNFHFLKPAIVIQWALSCKYMGATCSLVKAGLELLNSHTVFTVSFTILKRMRPAHCIIQNQVSYSIHNT